MTRRFLAFLIVLFPLAAWAQTAAQPELPKEPLVIVTKDGTHHPFDVEVAKTPEQQEIGLMFRKTVPPDGGMLFNWDQPRESTMWMRNTVSPLDMLFINADGTVRRVVTDTVPESLAMISSRGPVLATLELAAGTAQRLGIHAGDKVEQRIFGNAPGG